MAIAGSRAIIGQFNSSFVHLGPNLLVDKMMLGSRGNPVSLLDRVCESQATNRNPNSGRPRAAPSRNSVPEGYHQWLRPVGQELSRFVRKLPVRYGRRCYPFELCTEAMFFQLWLPSRNQWSTTVKTVHHKTGVRQGDHLPVCPSRSSDNSSATPKIVPNCLALQRKSPDARCAS